MQRAANPSSQPPASHRKHRRSALSRWLTPMLIDRMRRGTHDRADATGPCRGCATAVSCRAASCMSRRPCPRPVCYGAHCTSVAQTCRAARRVTRHCYRGRTRTSRRPRISGDAGYIRSIPASCTRKPFGGCSLVQIAAIAMVTHTHVPAEAASQTQACCCLLDTSIPYACHDEHVACRLTSRRE